MEKKFKILIVDDVPENLQVLINTLKNKYSILVAKNGKKALEIVDKGNRIDLILLDIMMPEMDGYEVCKRLKENSATAKIPIIFISVLDDTEAIVKGFEVGGVDYISKPFSVNEVLSRVNTHIELSCKQKELEQNLKLEQQQRKIQEKLMLQREKMAETGEMIAMIAHQWKQPLSSLGLVAMNIQTDLELEETISKEKLQKLVSDINGNVTYMSDTINDFRNFFKVDKEKTEVCVKEVIEKSIKIIGASIIKKGIALDHEGCKEGQKIEVFFNELIQVILNILKNSMEAFLENTVDTPKITIQCYEEGKSQVIEIEDNAGGISENIIEQVFDSEFTTKGEDKGTGMGLYMSKIIVEEHCKGTIGVVNTQNGAKFFIKIPIS